MADPARALAEAVREGLAACGVGPHDRLLVAASGGLDSTALVQTLAAIGQPAVLAHVDHGLRPDAGQDGAFVGRLAQHLGLRAERLAVTVGPGNVQSQARRARYRALAEAARSLDCAAVATGHTATDQTETVLMALVRGAGLRGLAGMPPRRTLDGTVDLVRPLLGVTRDALADAARQRGWAWREDPSNGGEAYRRNRLRHIVLPVLRDEGGPGVEQRVALAARHARDALALARSLVEHDRIPLDRLRALPAAARRAVIAEAVACWTPEALRSRSLIERLAGLVDAPVGARVASSGIQVWRERDALRYDGATGEGPAAGTFASEPLDRVPAAFPAEPFTEIVDLDATDGAGLRRWHPGDRIRPLGLGGSRAVSELLRERGVAVADRAAVAVVARGDEVLWVVGHRLAAAAAVTAKTQRAARWTWHRDEGAG